MSPRLLSVHAHPDDESSKGAATLAYYRSRGAEVMVVSCTGGERGEILNPAVNDLPLATRDLVELRRREMDGARRALDIQHRWLGYRDSGMARDDGTVPAASFADIPLEISARPLVRIVREFRPHVLISYDENGGYPHPDHIRAHDIAVRSRDDAAAVQHPELGEPWQILKHYYDRTFSAQRLDRILTAMIEEYPDSPRRTEWEELAERFVGTADEETPSTRVRVDDFFDARDAALRSHASQVAPDSTMFFWPNDLQRRVWPTEDFDLVYSALDTVRPGDRETDLFNGIEDLR